MSDRALIASGEPLVDLLDDAVGIGGSDTGLGSRLCSPRYTTPAQAGRLARAVGFLSAVFAADGPNYAGAGFCARAAPRVAREPRLDRASAVRSTFAGLKARGGGAPETYPDRR